MITESVIIFSKSQKTLLLLLLS